MYFHGEMELLDKLEMILLTIVNILIMIPLLFQPLKINWLIEKLKKLKIKNLKLMKNLKYR